MEIHISEKQEVFILTVKGDLDMYNTPLLKDSFNEIVAKNASKLLLNLKGVEYLDSSGVAVLLYIHNTSNKKNIRFYITGIHDQPYKVLQLTKLIGYFPLIKSLSMGFAQLTKSVTSSPQRL